MYVCVGGAHRMEACMGNRNEPQNRHTLQALARTLAVSEHGVQFLVGDLDVSESVNHQHALLHVIHSAHGRSWGAAAGRCSS